MAGWQSGDVQVDDLRLHYTRTGGAKPPVVLAHGFSDDGLCWTPVAEVLAPDYDVIMVDARGHGHSDAPDQGYNMASDLRGLIAALGLCRPPVVGHSIVRAAIARRPHRRSRPQRAPRAVRPLHGCCARLSCGSGARNSER